MAPFKQLAVALQALELLSTAGARRAHVFSEAAHGFPIRSLAAAGSAAGAAAGAAGTGHSAQPVAVAPLAFAAPTARGAGRDPEPSATKIRPQKKSPATPPPGGGDLKSPKKVDTDPSLSGVPEAVFDSSLDERSWQSATGRMLDLVARARHRLERPLHLPQAWKLNLENLKPMSRTEKSSFYSGRLRNDPRVRVFIKWVTPRNWEEVNDVTREMEVLKRLRETPGVVALYRIAGPATFAPGHEVLFLMEGADGNLEDLVLEKTFDEVPLRTRIKLFGDIVRAVKDMEDAGFHHGDLKPENVLVMGDCRTGKCSAVLCDLGSTSIVSNKERAHDQTIQSLAAILHRLLTEPGWLVDTHIGFRPKIGGFAPFSLDPDVVLNQAQFVALLQSMLDPKLHATTEFVLEVAEVLAQTNGVDLTPRVKEQRLVAWNDRPLPGWRIFLNRLAPRRRR